jgi:hypothetical protein
VLSAGPPGETTEHRCHDCGTYTASVFRICPKCEEKYCRVSGWCDQHGPKFGRCHGCSELAKLEAVAAAAARAACHLAVDDG